jgi:hypothetical protein
MLLFIRGSAHSAFLRAGPCVPHSSLPLPPPTRARVSAASVRAAGWPWSGRCPPVGDRPHAAWCPCCWTPPLSAIPRHPPLKREPPPTGRFPPPLAPFVSSVHTRAPHSLSPLPRHPPRRLPPPKPLLRIGLRLSVTTARPLPVSTPPSCSVPQSTAASSPPGLPRATGPLHTHRRPPELPRRR